MSGCVETEVGSGNPEPILSQAAAALMLMARSMLLARTERAISVLVPLRFLVRKRPPPVIRLMVAKGCSTAHRRLAMSSGLALAFIRVSASSSRWRFTKRRSAVVHCDLRAQPEQSDDI